MKRELDRFMRLLEAEWDRELAAAVPDPASGVPADALERLRSRRLEIIVAALRRDIEAWRDELRAELREIRARLPAPDRRNQLVLEAFQAEFGESQFASVDVLDVIQEHPGGTMAVAVKRWLGKREVTLELVARRLPGLVEQRGELVLRRVGAARNHVLYAVEVGPMDRLGPHVENSNAVG